MIHKLHFPELPLSQFVENLWLVDGFVADYTRDPSAYLTRRGDYLNYIPIA